MRRKLTVSGSRDARLAAVAARQRGRVSRRQLLQAGLSGGQVSWLVQRDRLFPLHLGVYAVGHPGPVPLGAETAALLAAPWGALLSHHSAAVLWEMPSVPMQDGLVELLIDARETVCRRGIRAHRSRLFSVAERRVRDGLPLTSPAQTLLDLATELSPDVLERVHDGAIVERIVRPGECERILRAMPTHPGAARLRSIVADARAGVTASVAEQELRALLRRSDLPAHRRNTSVLGYRLDFYWPEANLGVEVDGFRFHSSRRRFEADRVRDARLAAAGIEVIRITWRQLEREPFAVVARIAAAIARRSSDRPTVTALQP